MERKTVVFMIASLCACGLIFVLSCARPQGVKTESCQQMDATAGQSEEERLSQERQQEKEIFENENIYFDFDQSVLTVEARGVLERKASWLLSNADVSITIEGHCDERGTAEYNIALGERRARSAMDFLGDMGIESSRMRMVSYGEEKPLDSGHDECSWAKNRRAKFVIR
jgi:peptidoglycan-associated lipoprotein